jgi:hypothetical protein
MKIDINAEQIKLKKKKKSKFKASNSIITKIKKYTLHSRERARTLIHFG